MITLRDRLAAVATPRVEPQTVPAPIGGWNTRDALDAMDPTDAIVADNWVTSPGGLSSRGGSSVFASGLGSLAVETVAEFYSGSTRKLLGACGTSIFDATLGGTVGAAIGTGYANARWQTTMFNGHLFLANGADATQSYDGTTLGSAALTGPSTPLIGIISYRNRLFGWSANDNQFWFGGINAITGAMSAFPLGTVTDSGGSILLLTTMSHDGGDGVQDYLCIFMTSGEVVFYQGSDPASATNWSIAGRYKLANPVNIRAVARVGAEAYVTCSDDHVQISQALVALKLGATPPRSKASGAVSAAADNGGDALFGWQAIYYAHGSYVIFNVPNSDGTFYQHIYNVQQQGWSRFTGWDAHCFCLFANRPYFGSSAGKIFLADTGSTDDGVGITVDAQQAWNTFGVPIRKRVAALRPLLSTAAIGTLGAGLGFDFKDIDLPVSLVPAISVSLWDVSTWDVALWSPEMQIDTRWRVGGGTGISISLRLQGTILSPVQWFSTQYRMESGNAL